MGSSVPGAEYQVFLSFRGPDTRQGFADFLYHSLVDAGVRVFRDNEEIRPGEKIEEILRAIDVSVICIPIFSKGYASSKWCLRELAEMVEKKKRIMPVFYDVTPDDVKLRTHLYRDAMGRYEKENEKGQWEKALKEVVEISGWEPSDGKEEKALKEAVKVIGWEVKHTGHAQLCKLIVKDVLANLKVKKRSVTEHLVGVYKHVETLLKYLDLHAHGVRYVGIHGIGGSGKTTLAKAIFNQLSAQFEGCSFLADVRESSKRGLVSLQRKMILDLLPKDSTPISDTDDGINILKERCRAKKVLIVLDDVDEGEQIDALAGNPNWFSSGSRIIVTTRDVHVLGVEPDQLEDGSGKKSMGLWTLEMKEMDLEHSLQLFSKHAFKMEYPPDNFLDLSKQVVSTIGRLPLALEVIGSHLCGKPREAWEDSRTVLLRIPRNNIQKTLLISYQALEYRTKQIFLDIACFPVDIQMDCAIYMWRSCGLLPEIGIRELISTSLIKVTNDSCKRLWMHDLVRDLGKELVCMENFVDVGKRSRLWDHEEALGILERKEGTGRVELLHLPGDIPPEGCTLTNDHFRKLRNVRFLGLKGINIIGDFKHQLTKLRWLSWHSCPVDFEASNLELKKLVILDLSESNIDRNWKGWDRLKVGDNLTVLNLTSCQKMSRTPDFSQFRSLERLILNNCKELRQIDSSIGNLKSLKHLSLDGCYYLQGLPEEIGCLERLEELFISVGRDFITPLPESIGYLKSLVSLKIRYGGITGLPSTIGMLGKLKHLTILSCPLKRLPETLGDIQTLVELDLSGAQIDNLPGTIGCLKKLERLKLRYCQKIRQLPCSMGDLQSLSELDISYSSLLELPDSIGNLEELRTLQMTMCSVRTLPRSIGRMKKLEMLDAARSDLQGEIPAEIGRLSSLRTLDLSCKGLSELPDSIGNLEELRTLSITGSRVRMLPRSLGKLKNLERLDAARSDLQGEIPAEIGRLSCLRTLDLSCKGLSELPDSIGNLEELRTLSITGSRVRTLPRSLGKLKNLERLDAARSDLQGEIPAEIGRLSCLRTLDLSCKGLSELPDSIGNLEELRTLSITGSRVRTLPRSLGKLKNLERLDAARSDLQGEIPAEIGRLSCLRTLDLSCKGLSELPDSIGNLEELRTLSIAGSRVRTLPRSLGKLKNLERLDAEDSNLQGEIPAEIGGLSRLRVLDLSGTEICLLPSGISQLSSLESLWLERCHKLDELPRLPESLTCLRVVSVLLKRLDILSNQRSLTALVLDNGHFDRELYNFPEDLTRFRQRVRTFDLLEYTSLRLCLSNITTLPSWLLGIVSRLKYLILGCPALEKIPQLPSSLSSLVLMHLHEGMELPCLSNLQSLSRLMFSACSIGEDGFRRLGVGELGQLERLVLKESTGSSLDGLRVPGSLKIFHLYNCSNIGKLPDLSCLNCLEELGIVNCRHLRELPDLSHLKNLRVMQIKECEELVAMRGLGELESLEDLVISTCTSLERLWPSYQLSIRSNRLIISEYLPRLLNLRRLVISGCDSLHQISGLGSLPSLKFFRIEKCNSLRTVGPDPLPASLEHMVISSYTGIVKFGDVSHLKNLRYVWIGDGRWVGEVPGLEKLKLNMGEKGVAVRYYRDQDNFLKVVCNDKQAKI